MQVVILNAETHYDAYDKLRENTTVVFCNAGCTTAQQYQPKSDVAGVCRKRNIEVLVVPSPLDYAYMATDAELLKRLESFAAIYGGEVLINDHIDTECGVRVIGLDLWMPPPPVLRGEEYAYTDRHRLVSRLSESPAGVSTWAKRHTKAIQYLYDHHKTGMLNIVASHIAPTAFKQDVSIEDSAWMVDAGRVFEDRPGMLWMVGAAEAKLQHRSIRAGRDPNLTAGGAIHVGTMIGTGLIVPIARGEVVMAAADRI